MVYCANDFPFNPWPLVPLLGPSRKAYIYTHFLSIFEKWFIGYVHVYFCLVLTCFSSRVMLLKISLVHAKLRLFLKS